MDSGNSASLQSSSAGDDDQTSRAASGFIDGTLRLPGPGSRSFDPICGGCSRENKGAPTSGNGEDISKRNTAARATKKRSRAARRAPTTVLMTDTANFRAMVQEYTGVPSLPLPSGRRGFDFLPNKRLCSSMMAPPYLRRPFPMKFQPSIPPTADDAYENQNPPFSSLFQGSSPRFPFSIPPLNPSKPVLSPPPVPAAANPETQSQPCKLGFFNDFENPSSSSSITLQNLILFPDQNEDVLGSRVAESINGGPYIFFGDDDSNHTADYHKSPENSALNGGDGGLLGSPWICSSELK
ncbi:hypothetical protein M569_05381 [Genlisea aurea]|uniref:VQ domain-containing protein n=1 Tax=Genlisea aurea TaxID=192259 RepID=S8CRI3_9LAMI|nr:hypothetical protein M569_05381 [Genlisea aurea]